jgi:hypothetical protein
MLLTSFLLATSFTFPVNVKAAGYAGPYYMVEPANVTMGPKPAINNMFTVDVKLYNVTAGNVPAGILGVEVKIGWDPSLLEFVSRVKMVGQPGGVLNPSTFEAKDTNETNYYWLASASMSPALAWWGNGSVVRLTFKVISQPEEPEPKASCFLEIIFSDLVDYDARIIPHDIVNGYYEILPIPMAPIPTLKVQPTRYAANHVGETFQVNITILELNETWNLGRFELKLNFSSDALTVLNVEEGSFLNGFGSTLFNKTIDNATGVVSINATQLAENRTTPYGSGVLAAITFNATSRPPASCDLELFDTKLVVWEQPEKLIPFYVNNGYYELIEVLDHIVQFEDYTFHVITRSNSSVMAPPNLAFNSTEKTISFNVTGRGVSLCFCNVTIPKDLMRAENLTAWKVKIDNAIVSYTATENATCTILYFTYQCSTRNVQIMGTWAISKPSPQPPIDIILLTSLAAIIVIVAAVGVFWLRKRKTRLSSTKK